MPGEKFPQIPVSKKNENLEDAVDALISRLPSDLQELWSHKLENLPLEKQVETLESLLAKRDENQKLKHESLLLPEGVEIFESFPDDMRDAIEAIRTGERSIEVGYGKAGHVIANEELHPGICYKLLFDDEVLPLGTNDIASETEIQQKVGKLLDGAHGVMVPNIFGFISEPGTRAITMELMNAPSLRKVVERKKEELPKNFNFDTFFSALSAFIDDMHKQGYYHRDLHAGNVLVHRETGMPCVIDFGLSKFSPIEDIDTYRDMVVKDGQMVPNVLYSDEANLEKLKVQVQQYLANRQGAYDANN